MELNMEKGKEVKEEKEQGGDRRSAEGAHVFLGMSTMESYKGKRGTWMNSEMVSKGLVQTSQHLDWNESPERLKEWRKVIAWY